MFVIVFIDEILVYSKSDGEHEAYLCKVLSMLKAHQLYAKFFKCEFQQRKVTFLGHVVLGSDILVDQAKVEATMDCPNLPQQLK